MPTPQFRGYIYLIGSSVFGWYKIGKSIRPEIRTSDLGVLLPFKIEVFSIWGSNAYSIVESSLHKHFKLNQINGEWFTFDLTDMAIINKKAEQLGAEQIFKRTPWNPRYCNHVNNVITGSHLLTTIQKKQKNDAFNAACMEYMDANHLDRTKENWNFTREIVLAAHKKERANMLSSQAST